MGKVLQNWLLNLVLGKPLSVTGKKIGGKLKASAAQLVKKHWNYVSSYDKIDEVTFLWFTQERQEGVPISGTLIQEKAQLLNKLMNGDPTFTASNGWLDHWKKRHGI